MPLNEDYLETHEVIRLTQHFLASKAQEGHFAEYKTYFQSPQEGVSFGGDSPSSVIAVAERSAHQPPVIFACDGQPEDRDRKEKKEPWKLSEIVLKAMSEWVCSQQQPQEESKALDFNLHLTLRKDNHWTVYIFEFKKLQSNILTALAELKKQHRQAEIPRKPKEEKEEKGKVDDLAYQAQQRKQKEAMHGLLSNLYQSVRVSHIDPKRWEVPQTIQADLKAIFGHTLPITQLECACQADGYTCGDRAARNTVAAACGHSLDYNIDSYYLRLETMAILGTPLVEDADFPTGYILLRFVSMLILCFLLNYVLNHFVAANALAAIGGAGGLLGIGLITWLLFEVRMWLMRPETKPGEAAQYEGFKPKAVSPSVKPVSCKSLLAPTVASSSIPVSEPVASSSPQPSASTNLPEQKII